MPIVNTAHGYAILRNFFFFFFFGRGGGFKLVTNLKETKEAKCNVICFISCVLRNPMHSVLTHRSTKVAKFDVHLYVC